MRHMPLADRLTEVKAKTVRDTLGHVENIH